MYIALLLCAALALASCAKPTNERRYTLAGQVQSIDLPRKLVVVKHGEIKGFMPAMTMPYDVQDASALNGIKAGDLVTATLVVYANGAYLTAVKKTGEAPLEQPPPEADASPPPSAASGFELLETGDTVPNAPFVDQDGRPRRFADFRGSPLAITFIYTRCPLPTFCPLMDRHFAAVQKSLASDASLRRVHLVTVSFDPVTDTPAVLKAHAGRLGADLSRWTFLTGDRDEIDRFAARFGVSVSRALNDPRDITHNLRTAVVDGDGRLVKVYTGNDWTPDQLLADLKALGPRAS
jgi:protein SCO1